MSVRKRQPSPNYALAPLKLRLRRLDSEQPTGREASIVHVRERSE